MDINNPTTQQSGMAPLYPQTQQQLRSQAQRSAETPNPVEESKESSNEQQQASADNAPSQNNGQIDTYA